MRNNLVHHLGSVPFHLSRMFFLKQSRIQRCYTLGYGEELKGLEATCPCGQKYNTTLALICKTVLLVTITHSKIRDYEANLLAKIHTDVETEPSLQPIEGEVVNGILSQNARPGVRASVGQNAERW